MKVRSHAPRQFPAVKGSFTTVKVTLQPHLNISVSISCTFVVDTLLNFPTLFNIILTYANTSCVSAFRHLLVSVQDWAYKSVSFRLVLAISRTETRITASYLEITSSSFVNTLIILEKASSLVLIQSWNRNAIRANVNKPSDAKVCRALWVTTQHLSFVTYDPHDARQTNREKKTNVL